MTKAGTAILYHLVAWALILTAFPVVARQDTDQHQGLPPGLWWALQQDRHQIEVIEEGYRTHNPASRQSIAFRTTGITVMPAATPSLTRI